MGTAIAGKNALTAVCDNQFPSNGTIGQLTLLSGDLKLNLAAIADSTYSELYVANHGLVTGSRVRLVGNPLPSPLAANTDYWAIVVDSNTIQVADSAGQAIELYDNGSGVLLNEQRLTASDDLAVLLNKEVQHPSWANRLPLNNLGAAAISSLGTAAEKPPTSILVPNADAAVLSFRHVLLLIGPAASNVIGTSNGVQSHYVSDEGIDWALNQGDTKSIVVQLRAEQA
jgi:hypothetical protein